MKASKLVIAVIWLAATGYGAQRPPALDPNSIPFAIDPNAYAADLIEYIVADPNVSVVSTCYAHNRGGWDTELAVVMADGSPTSSVIQKLTPRPVRDPNGGWNQGFQWGWTPPGEGVFYLELRLTTKGKPSWKGDARTIVVYAFGEDPPFLWVCDPPTLRLTQAQRLWQHAGKVGRPLTSPTRVWR